MIADELEPAELSAADRRDALVAGFVPGIALGWSWPDMLRHAVALAASVSPEGEADLAAYEKLLPDVIVADGRQLPDPAAGATVPWMSQAEPAQTSLKP